MIIVAVNIPEYFSGAFLTFSLALDIYYLDLWHQFRASLFAICGWLGCAILRHGPRVLNQEHAGGEGGAEG